MTINSNLRFDCHARNVAKAYNFHTLALRHVRSLPSSGQQRRRESSLQHRRFEARLLQRPAVRRTGDDIQQTAARPEQPGQSRLALSGSHRRQAAAPVAPLVSSEAAGHLQGGSTHHKVRTTATPAYLLSLIHI